MIVHIITFVLIISKIKGQYCLDMKALYYHLMIVNNMIFSLIKNKLKVNFAWIRKHYVTIL